MTKVVEVERTTASLTKELPVLTIANVNLVALVGIGFVQRLSWHYASDCADLPILPSLVGLGCLGVFLSTTLITISLRLRSDALVVRMCSAYVFLANVEFTRITTETWGIAFPCLMRGATF